MKYDVLITGLQTGELMMKHLSENNSKDKYLEMEKKVSDLLVFVSGIVLVKRIPDLGTFEANHPFLGLSMEETKEILHILAMGDIKMDALYMLNLCRRLYADVMARTRNNDNVSVKRWKDGVATLLLHPDPEVVRQQNIEKVDEMFKDISDNTLENKIANIIDEGERLLSKVMK